MPDTKPPIKPFNFTAPMSVKGLSDISNAAIQVGAIASKLAQEKRTIVSNPDGRPENVSEHSHMLSMVAEVLAEEFFPDLDSAKVASYAAIHDAVEAYTGDTPTHIISDQGLLDKHALEQEGLLQLKNEYAHLPKFVARIEKYELQVDPEARFVRMVDKLMPQLIHIYDDGACLKKSGYGPQQLRKNAQERTAQWIQAYPDMARLLDSRNELTELVIKIVEPYFS